MLRIEDEQEFVASSLERIGAQPPNFRNIVEINRGDLLTDSVDAHPLAPRQLERKVADDAFLVDVRTAPQFDDAHIPGATHITILEPGFASKLAWLADPERDVVFAGRDNADGVRAVRMAQAVGLRRLAGYLDGGMTAWREEDRPTQSSERISIEELRARQDEGAFQLLDVREPHEYEAGHIPGSRSVPWHDIDAVPDGLDPDGTIVTVCASGRRAGVAGSLLQRAGAEHVLHVPRGGVGEWRRRGWPIETGA
jgi:rhodanese-related sulfurtransferase